MCVVVNIVLPAYSVLTHEAIIDSAWEQGIQSLLLRRFPQATPDELRKAHAFAYGGCIIQDMGYYPLGSKFFSDLTHYVRSGQFIQNLLKESQNLNQYAFALGALAHYAADDLGHSIAVNRVVPMLYPKLRARFGDDVTYAQNPTAHIRSEFGFDVLQVARGNYVPQAYHDFIGFEVDKDLLDRAMQDTYDLKLKDVFRSVDLAIGTYRHAVGSVIPKSTKVAWELKKDQLTKATPGLTRKKFIFNISRSVYRKEWGSDYKEPGPGAKVLAFLSRLVPKIGPLKSVQFKPPTAASDKLFMESFNRSLDMYRRLLGDAGQNRLALRDIDFDTGRPTRAGEYPLADKAYARLTTKLAQHGFANAAPELRDNILGFYKNLDAPIATKKKRQDWAKLTAALDQLKNFESHASSADRQKTGR